MDAEGLWNLRRCGQMPTIHGTRMPHLWRIDQGHWGMAGKESSRNKPETAKAYNPSCDYTGAELDGERLAGYEEVPT